MALNDSAHDPVAHGPDDDWRPRLAHAIDHAAHLLPAQGPITVFIHHNTLHAFEDLTFDEAVGRGADAFGCEPYLSEDRYRAELGRGRIRPDGLRAVLRDDLGPRADDPVGPATRAAVRAAMLDHPACSGTDAEREYVMAETDARTRFGPTVAATARGRIVAETRRWAMRDLRGRGDLFPVAGVADVENWGDAAWEAFAVQALWRACLAGTAALPPAAAKPAGPVRHRDALFSATGTDPDLWVHDLLIRAAAAFLDQGVSGWPLPDRAAGFYTAFLKLYARPNGPPDAWLRPLPAEANRLLAGHVAPLDSVRESLTLLGVSEAEWDEYLSATLLALRGWGGMVREVETRGDRVAHAVPKGSLVEFVAVRLILDRLAAAHAADRDLGFTSPLATLRGELAARAPAAAPPPPARRAFPVFRLAQTLGWSAEELSRLSPAQWAELVHEIESFDSRARRRIFHLAYERRFRVQTLDAVALHTRHAPPAGFRPRFQAITCLDEREESFRRHLEEVAPDCETLGAAGFFGVAIYYRGTADAHFVPLCPIVLTPDKWVAEKPCADARPAHARQVQTRRAFGRANRRFQSGTRSAAAGAVLTAGVGVLASVPLFARVLFPRLAARTRDWFGRKVFTPPATELQLERTAPVAGPAGDAVGFTAAEMAAVAERLLRDVGLVTTFGRLVFVLGHGSDSVNNPHKSAYDCGACGGSPGAPNGRALAQMLNDPRVRATLAGNGVNIPADTWFVGGCHNTCDDSVVLADIDRVPPSHRPDLAAARADFDAAGERNAHERSRRFLSARLDQTFAEARRHVENRSEDLAQVRPELGHATNAICVVGRRTRTRGLFLDRRAFLASYDPTQDSADGFTLARILGAAVPVCGGINLEYYFSHVDSRGYGAGTKLPHNVTALLGVMDGAASDLRTGLPWQMVEIHEPVRLLFVVESTPDIILCVMARSAVIGGMVRNGWVQMTVLDPDSGAIQVFRDGAFRPHDVQAAALPRARSSADWYRGWRDHLEFAAIDPGA